MGIGSYKGTQDYRFVIVPAQGKVKRIQTKNGSKARIRISVKPQKGVSGYQYAWRLKGKKTWNATSSTGKVKVVKKLKKGKRYQVRVRAFKKIDGKKWYGKWSTVKYIRTKK